MPDRELITLLTCLYEAAVGKKKWQYFLKPFSESFNSFTATLTYSDCNFVSLSYVADNENVIEDCNRLYKPACGPLKIEYTLCVYTEISPSCVATLGLYRSENQGDFNNSECNLLNDLVPHMQRAIKLFERENINKSDLLLSHQSGLNEEYSIRVEGS